MLRRTRLGLLAGRELSDPASDAPARVARALAGEAGWVEARIEDAVRRFREEAEAEGIGLQ